MSRSVSELVKSVVEEGNFDATEAQALAWLSARHETMCARSKCYRRKIPIGPTIKEQASYPMPPEIVEIRELQVQSKNVTPSLGVPYGPGRHLDLAEGALHYIWLGGLYLAVGGGIYVRDEGSSGEDLLALFPTPTEAGLEITVYAICRPEPLLLTAPSLVVGGTGTFRFASTSRVLTEAEKATFVSGGGLPAATGTEAGVVSVVFEAKTPGSAWAVVANTKDAVGAYKATVSFTVPGGYLWRAKGYSEAAGKGTVVWQTPVEEAQVSSGLMGLKVPPEYYDALISGAMAIGLSRIESRDDIAQAHEAHFSAACTELTAQVNKRYRAQGPAQVRVQGFNA